MPGKIGRIPLILLRGDKILTIDKRFLIAVALALALHWLVALAVSGTVRVGGRQFSTPSAGSAPIRISLISPIPFLALDAVPQVKPVETLPDTSASDAKMALRKQMFNLSERVLPREPRNLPVDARQASKVDAGPKESKESCIPPDQVPDGESTAAFGSNGRVLCEQG